MKTLTIDIGASSGRTIVVDYSNGVLTYEETSRFYHEIEQTNQFLTWNLAFICEKIIEGIRNSLKKYPDIKSIGIDTWGVDYVYVNSYNQNVSNAISYRDNRTDKSVEEVHSKISFKSLYLQTGIQFQKFNSIYQIYDDFFIHNRVIKNNTNLLLIPDYIAYVLTGEKYFELTNASTTGLLDINTKDISKNIVENLNIPAEIFPKFIKPGQLIGYTKASLFNVAIPVIATCSHDTANAILGTPLTKNSVFVSSGTWSLIGAELNKPINNELALKHNFSNELGYGGSIDFLKNTMGMFAINELLKEWRKNGEDITPAKFPSFINQAPKYEGFINFDDNLFFQPKNMLVKMHQYLKKTNQSLPIFKGQIIDCIYASLALRYAYIINELKEVTGKQFDKIVISGGGNQADILNQYVANATNLKVVTGPIESTVTGNAICQLISKGEIKDVSEARKIIASSIKSKTFIPENIEGWKEKYNRYLKIIEGEKNEN